VGITGGSASADPTPTQNIALHTATAGVGTDCPDTVHDYWHFVIAPNHTYTFVAIHLNIGGTIVTPQLIPNHGQYDNVFVAVPAGKSLSDLIAAGSSADITPAAPEATQFNLSHTCVGTGTSSSEETSSSQETSS